MLESITDIMSMMDRDLNILWANELAKRGFGKGHRRQEVFRSIPSEKDAL